MNSLNEAKSSPTEATCFEFALRKEVKAFESKAISKIGPH